MREGGSLPHVGPNPGAGGGGPYWCGFFVQAPWRTYIHYNDPRLIEKYYSQMKEWFKYVDKYTRGGNINSKVDKTGVVVQEIKKDEKGRVKIGDVEWLAVSNEDISEGTKVRITNVYGNTLCVEKVEEV